MSNDSELARQQSYTDLNDSQLAATLAASGYFDDSKKSQAMTKVLAGREMGFGPVTSLKNIHFVKGNIEVGGQLIASKIRQSDKYDYRIDEHTDEVCTVTIVDSEGNELGSVSWDMDRAEQANLTGKGNWNKYPRNMLFNRAISDARRFYCPDVMETGPYTKGEIPRNGNGSQPQPSKEQSQDVQEANYEVEDDGEGDTEDETDDEPDMTDAARELAEEHDIYPDHVDLLDGTGENGRILKSDVQELLEEQSGGDDGEQEDNGGSTELNMPEVQKQLDGIVGPAGASWPDVRATLEEIGYTQENVDRLADHLTDVEAGKAKYSTDDNGVIQFK